MNEKRDDTLDKSTWVYTVADAADRVVDTYRIIAESREKADLMFETHFPMASGEKLGYVERMPVTNESPWERGKSSKKHRR